MLESIRITEKLYWPKQDLSRKSLFSMQEKNVLDTGQSVMAAGVLRDTFLTGTSSYNVLLQSKKEDKKQGSPKKSLLGQNKKLRKSNKTCIQPRSKKKKVRAASPNCFCAKRNILNFISTTKDTSIKYSQSISVSGSTMRLTNRPKLKSRRKHYLPSLPEGKESQILKPKVKEEVSGKKICILNAIKPSNVEKEKVKFFKSQFSYNPQFEYVNPALPSVLARNSQASERFLHQAIHIMQKAIEKYGNYERFEQATGGSLLPKSRIYHQVRKYMEKEGCQGEIVVHLTEDLLSRASMTFVNGRPTLTINLSAAREQWLEGILRHEIGTHYFRGMNNIRQPWSNGNGRKKYGLKTVNPTEEGLASIHSVLFRKDPYLWRAALLYYTVYQASCMSFSELFQDLRKFVMDPNTRWDYCVRAKRGWTDTSQPGCFSKDQVYLDGILRILRHRHTIDFHLLISMGKLSLTVIDGHPECCPLRADHKIFRAEGSRPL
uniref:Microtubule associated tyrosine carboxypeptidase 2 n=1 Tax=Leptobrachium leishanense TaxID=445787 RepID=A0A8C5MUZ5_9ANUR